MSHQPVRAWQALLQRLSDLKSAYTVLGKGSTDDLPQYDAVQDAFNHLRDIPRPVPRATLKKIVQEQQVSVMNPTS